MSSDQVIVYSYEEFMESGITKFVDPILLEQQKKIDNIFNNQNNEEQ